MVVQLLVEILHLVALVVASFVHLDHRLQSPNLHLHLPYLQVSSALHAFRDADGPFHYFLEGKVAPYFELLLSLKTLHEGLLQVVPGFIEGLQVSELLRQNPFSIHFSQNVFRLPFNFVFSFALDLVNDLLNLSLKLSYELISHLL